MPISPSLENQYVTPQILCFFNNKKFNSTLGEFKIFDHLQTQHVSSQDSDLPFRQIKIFFLLLFCQFSLNCHATNRFNLWDPKLSFFLSEKKISMTFVALQIYFGSKKRTSWWQTGSNLYTETMLYVKYKKIFTFWWVKRASDSLGSTRIDVDIMKVE